MLTPEGQVMTEAQMKKERKQPAYIAIRVQTAEGMLETWQMLPVPVAYVPEKEEKQEESEKQGQLNQGIIQFPEQQKREAA